MPRVGTQHSVGIAKTLVLLFRVSSGSLIPPCPGSSKSGQIPALSSRGGSAGGETLLTVDELWPFHCTWQQLCDLEP